MFYSQRNLCWSGDNLGFGYTTIGNYGCVITSFGMGLGVNPSVVNWALKRVNGYTGSNKNLVIWHKVAEAFPELTLKSLIHCVTIPAPVDKIDECLANNDLVIVRIDMNLFKPGIQHHWLYVYGGNGKDGYKVYDPWALSAKDWTLPPVYSKEGWDAARAIYSAVIYSRG